MRIVCIVYIVHIVCIVCIVCIVYIVYIVHIVYVVYIVRMWYRFGIRTVDRKFGGRLVQTIYDRSFVHAKSEAKQWNVVQNR